MMARIRPQTTLEFKTHIRSKDGTAARGQIGRFGVDRMRPWPIIAAYRELASSPYEPLFATLRQGEPAYEL
jgi:hypothetical protein